MNGAKNPEVELTIEKSWVAQDLSLLHKLVHLGPRHPGTINLQGTIPDNQFTDFTQLDDEAPQLLWFMNFGGS